ncbi:MAG: hypothetical protein HPY81_03575 [Firmicutes bacterium]|nr:hypothetical protein [Bacillota bacterium]
MSVQTQLLAYPVLSRESAGIFLVTKWGGTAKACCFRPDGTKAAGFLFYIII